MSATTLSRASSERVNQKSSERMIFFHQIQKGNNMQQYFCETPVEAGGTYIFTKEQAHHARDVVRLENEQVRLVWQGRAFYAFCRKKDGVFLAEITEEDPKYNENKAEVILASALIRREKFELVLQKATELGVTRIIPFVSSRCVVREKPEKAQKVLARWNGIVREAAEQCKRNVIPEVTETMSFEQLLKQEAELKLAAYENAYGSGESLSDLIAGQKSILIVIGPEGGFSTAEVGRMEEAGFVPVTLGSRILRAETAAIASAAMISELSEQYFRNHAEEDNA